MYRLGRLKELGEDLLKLEKVYFIRFEKVYFIRHWVFFFFKAKKMHLFGVCLDCSPGDTDPRST